MLAFSVTFLPNIIKSPSMLSRVIAKNVGDVFFETQCRSGLNFKATHLNHGQHGIRSVWNFYFIAEADERIKNTLRKKGETFFC